MGNDGQMNNIIFRLDVPNSQCNRSISASVSSVSSATQRRKRRASGCSAMRTSAKAAASNLDLLASQCSSLEQCRLRDASPCIPDPFDAWISLTTHAECRTARHAEVKETRVPVQHDDHIVRGEGLVVNSEPLRARAEQTNLTEQYLHIIASMHTAFAAALHANHGLSCQCVEGPVHSARRRRFNSRELKSVDTRATAKRAVGR